MPRTAQQYTHTPRVAALTITDAGVAPDEAPPEPAVDEYQDALRQEFEYLSDD